MLVYTYELLKERKDIREGWQRRFPYILIDEFQDINQIQYDIVRMLAAPGNNLFIVGDDDQSIYRFRGARPEIMLNFKKIIRKQSLSGWSSTTVPQKISSRAQGASSPTIRCVIQRRSTVSRMQGKK